MTPTCAYCPRPAVAKLPTVRGERVCTEHAIEYWRGLLDANHRPTLAIMKAAS
jgi:hypothetical protein